MSRRLCFQAEEISNFARTHDWSDVGYNLRLAYSLTDLSADTNIDGAAFWCEPVADYEKRNSEITAKHLAATIVFTFVWTAYECAVETLKGGKGPRGAQGRDLAAARAKAHMPYLKILLDEVLAISRDQVEFSHPEMRRMLGLGSIPGVAGEYLRQFRNRLVHGDMPKPDPDESRDNEDNGVDAAPHLRRFHLNIRLTLLLIQILLIPDVEEGDYLDNWLDEPCLARFSLERLHVAPPDGMDDMLFGEELSQWPLFSWG
jgi:hypothetical protein